MKTRWWSLLACLTLGAALADPAPAQLTVGERAIEALLQIPEGLARGQYTVNCQGRIRVTGWADRFDCYADPDVPYALVKAMILAGRRASFVPATRDGRRVEVFMVLSTFVDIVPGGPHVLTVPNNGADRERYGLLYSSPQNTVESRTRRPLVPRPRGLQNHPSEMLAWMLVDVDAAGHVTGHSLRDVAREPSPTATLESFIERLEFIPAYHDGKPVPAVFAEPLYSVRALTR